MAPSLDEACRILLLNDAMAFKAASETLFKICQNIFTHPDEPKYRKISRGSASFSEKLASAKGAVRFLKAVGFEEEGGSSDVGSLVLPALPDIAERMTAGKAALKAALKYHTEQMVRATEEARSRENAAAAQKLADLRDVSKKNSAQRTAEEAAERQRLVEGIQGDKTEENNWRKEYDEMGVPGMKPTK